MNKLVFASTLLALAAAAQLPSTAYLPQRSESGLNNLGSVNGPGSGNIRPQQALERSSAILKQDQEIGEDAFRYSYETSNGIQAEEVGSAGQSRGAFAYKGDDGKVYSVTFTAGEDGYRPQGDHLPVPPPTPVEILLALKQNEQDEAAGIFDDGQYRPDNNQGKAGQNFGSANRQGSFNSKSGYNY